MIGQDIIQISSFGEYMVNGVGHAEMPNDLSGHLVTHNVTAADNKEHHFRIGLANGEGIVVHTMKDIVSVKMLAVGTSTVADFEHSQGLMGEFGTGKMLARDGVTEIHDTNSFGQEWQVRPNQDPQIFLDNRRPPQYPQQCKLPSKTAKDQRRRLGESIAREAAEKACAHWKNEEEREGCIFDVMATGDLELAVAGGY
jgi:hypothetical protein